MFALVKKSISLGFVAHRNAIALVKPKAFVGTAFFSTTEEGREPTIEEIIAKIDTTLTPEQRIYVDQMKKKYKGQPGKKCKTEVFGWEETD